MSKKIIGVTVGTPMNPSYLKDKLNPVTSVNGVTADENGNVEITIPDSGGDVDLTGYTELLPESSYPVSEEMKMVLLDREPTFIAGKTYLVKWNGVDYVRVAYEDDEVVLLGEDGDPFSLEFHGDFIDMYALDGSTSVTLAIYEKAKYATEEWVEEKLKEHSGGNVKNGIPPGGKTGQYLCKQSDADYDVVWSDLVIPEQYGLVTYDQDKTITIT